jgi:hypothetical protein
MPYKITAIGLPPTLTLYTDKNGTDAPRPEGRKAS